MLKWFYRTFPLDKRVKMLQAFAYIGLIIGLVLYFDWAWLVAGLAYSWILFLVVLAVDYTNIQVIDHLNLRIDSIKF